MERVVRVKRGAPGYPIEALPYRVRVYVNNQVLVPARLVRALGIANIRHVDIVMVFNGRKILLRGVRLLRTKHTDSRQFTIPKAARERFGIRPGDEVEIVEIRRSEDYGRVR